MPGVSVFKSVPTTLCVCTHNMTSRLGILTFYLRNAWTSYRGCGVQHSTGYPDGAMTFSYLMDVYKHNVVVVVVVAVAAAWL